MGFLNDSIDENLRTLKTSARDDGTGNPITDVFVKGRDASGNEVALKVNANGEVLTQLSGRKVAQTKTQSDAVGGVVTFSKNIDYIAIYNTSNTDGIFNVNGLDLFVPANTPFSDPIGGTPRATVDVTGATSYAIMRYE